MSNLLQHGGNVAAQSNMIMYLDSKNQKSYGGEPTTNLLTSPNDFSNVSYTNYSAILTEYEINSTIKSSFWKMQTTGVTNSSDACRIAQGLSGSYIVNATGGFRAVSIYAKKGTHDKVCLSTETTTNYGWPFGAIFDLTNGSVVSVTSNYGGVQYASIDSIGNGWYRLSFYYEIGTYSSNRDNGFSFSLASLDGTSRKYLGTGSEFVYIAKAQAEEKPYPTAYTSTSRPYVDGWRDLSKNSNHADLSLCNFDEDGIIFSNSSENYASIAHNSTHDMTQNITLMAWFKTSSTSHQSIIRKRLGNEERYALDITSGKLFWSCWVVNGVPDNRKDVIASTGDITLNQWHHGCIVLDSTSASTHTLYFYLDGELVHTESNYNHTLGTTTVDLTIGGGEYGDGGLYHMFNGRIDLPIIYNTALTADEVRSNYLCHRSRFS